MEEKERGKEMVEVELDLYSMVEMEKGKEMMVAVVDAKKTVVEVVSRSV
jgi:hypothetical protein